jgi:hypothetical protein
LHIQISHNYYDLPIHFFSGHNDMYICSNPLLVYIRHNPHPRPRGGRFNQPPLLPSPQTIAPSSSSPILSAILPMLPPWTTASGRVLGSPPGLRRAPSASATTPPSQTSCGAPLATGPSSPASTQNTSVRGQAPNGCE